MIRGWSFGSTLYAYCKAMCCCCLLLCFGAKENS